MSVCNVVHFSLGLETWEKITLIRTFKAHGKTITALTLHPKTHTMFLSVSLDCTIKLWSLEVKFILVLKFSFRNSQSFIAFIYQMD
jgi:WD40 repeat protein